MSKITLESDSGTISVEIEDSYTFKSKGVEIDFDLDDLCEEGLAKLWWHAKRWITDGSKSESSEDEHADYIESKLEMLRGDKPFGASRSGDAVAREMRPLVMNSLIKAGMKRKSIPILGATVKAVTLTAVSLGLDKALVLKIVAHAEAIADLKAQPLDE